MDLNEPTLGVGARIKHPSLGEGIVVSIEGSTINAFFREEGDRQISDSFKGLRVLEAPHVEEKPAEEPKFRDMQASLRLILEEISGLSQPVEMAEKWEGGKLVLKPGNENLQSKEIAIDSFFHKIVMVRDRLRVLEQNINSHEKLEESDKVHLQQYISRIYGSLTTFNVFFADKVDYFSSKA